MQCVTYSQCLLDESFIPHVPACVSRTGPCTFQGWDSELLDIVMQGYPGYPGPQGGYGQQGGYSNQGYQGGYPSYAQGPPQGGYPGHQVCNVLHTVKMRA